MVLAGSIREEEVTQILIVTNNPLLKDEDGIKFVEGTFRDVLIAVRDLVFSGYELVSHPLFASSRMMFSPFRTVILGKKMDRPSPEECEVAENSLALYDNVTAHRNVQPEHDEDYAYMDLRLHEAALKEASTLVNSHVI